MRNSDHLNTAAALCTFMSSACVTLCVCVCVCLRQCEHEDSIEFQGKEGSFQVRLRGIIPCHTLEVPESVMLPLCAVEHFTHTDFLLKNARYSWLCLCSYFIQLVYVCVYAGRKQKNESGYFPFFFKKKTFSSIIIFLCFHTFFFIL